MGVRAFDNSWLSNVLFGSEENMGDDLKEFIRTNPPRKFRSSPVYSRDGDFLAFFLKDADHYAHRVDHLLTVYLDMDCEKLVGFKIKGVRRMIRALGRFNIIRTVPDGKQRLKLNVLLLPGMMVATGEQLERYEEIDELTADVELDPAEMQLI